MQRIKFLFCDLQKAGFPPEKSYCEAWPSWACDAQKDRLSSSDSSAQSDVSISGKKACLYAQEGVFQINL